MILNFELFGTTENRSKLRKEWFSMLWCPKCKLEYHPSHTTCGECGTKLVEKGEKTGVSPRQPDLAAGGAVKKPRLLTTVSSETQLQYLSDCLAEQGILVFLPDEEEGGIQRNYMGFGTTGREVYVEESDLESALELLDSLPDSIFPFQDNQEEKDSASPTAADPSPYLNKWSTLRKVVAWAMLILFLLFGYGAVGRIF